MTHSRECCGNNEGKLSFTKHPWMSFLVSMRVYGEQTRASKHRGPLVGELREVLVVALLLPLGDLDQVAALLVRRGQLHTLAGELGVKVP